MFVVHLFVCNETRKSFLFFLNNLCTEEIAARLLSLSAMLVIVVRNKMALLCQQVGILPLLHYHFLFKKINKSYKMTQILL